MIKYITYRRVSTKEQGKSGLGLDAQERDIRLYLENYSGQPWEIIKEFTEVKSGGNGDRPLLKEAVALAKKEKAVLLVAKLDRLSRSVAFIAALMEDKKLSFRVASMPNADNFQLHIYASLAQQEREFIGIRTKAALKAWKVNEKERADKAGETPKKLGGLRDETMKRNKVMMEQAQARAVKLEGLVVPMRDQGKNLRDIAKALNENGIGTPRGGEWHPTSVKRLLARL